MCLSDYLTLCDLCVCTHVVVGGSCPVRFNTPPTHNRTKGPTTRHYQSYVTRNPSKSACHEGLTPPHNSSQAARGVLTTPLRLLHATD